jgi:hypothetical protein
MSCLKVHVRQLKHIDQRDRFGSEFCRRVDVCVWSRSQFNRRSQPSKQTNRLEGALSLSLSLSYVPARTIDIENFIMTATKCFPSCIWFAANKANTRENIWRNRPDFSSLDDSSLKGEASVKLSIHDSPQCLSLNHGSNIFLSQIGRCMVCRSVSHHIISAKGLTIRPLSSWL